MFKASGKHMFIIRFIWTRACVFKCIIIFSLTTPLITGASLMDKSANLLSASAWCLKKLDVSTRVLKELVMRAWACVSLIVKCYHHVISNQWIFTWNSSSLSSKSSLRHNSHLGSSFSLPISYCYSISSGAQTLPLNYYLHYCTLIPW